MTDLELLDRIRAIAARHDRPALRCTCELCALLREADR